MSYLDDTQFEKFKTLIYNASGLHFSDINRPILESRLRNRMKEINIASPDEYYNLLIREEGELKEILDHVTTNLTKFFRNESHFDALNTHALPQLIKIKQDSNDLHLKVWSAGCSTGEEPYSIAICIMNTLGASINRWKVDILASDLSLKSLMKAKEGTYTKDRLEGIKEPMVTAYFNRLSENEYQVKQTLKNIIRFDYHNLNYDNGERHFDIIFCRNVIIYFDSEAQKKVIKGFYESLNSYGFLFIGHSESLFGMNTGFKFYKIDNACIYKKE